MNTLENYKEVKAGVNAGSLKNRLLPDYICIMSNTRFAKVQIDEIEMIERISRKLNIYTGDTKHVCYEKIERVIPLLAGRSFYRAMKGVVINFERVKEVTTQEVIFVSGRKYLMGKNNLTKLRRAFRSYLLQYPQFNIGTNAIRVAEEGMIDDDGLY